MFYHIPDKVGQPVKERLHSADELHVFGLVHSLLDEEDYKACRDKGHGEDHADGNQHIHWCRHPEGGRTDHRKQWELKSLRKGQRNVRTVYARLGNDTNTHSATCDSCSLVRLSGWLWAVMPNFVGSLPPVRLARRMPLFITLRKEPMLCQPLLLNQIWRESERGRAIHLVSVTSEDTQCRSKLVAWRWAECRKSWRE